MDVKIKEFKLLPHGFLSFNFPIFGMKEEAKEGIKEGICLLNELLDHESNPS